MTSGLRLGDALVFGGTTEVPNVLYAGAEESNDTEPKGAIGGAGWARSSVHALPCHQRSRPDPAGSG